MSSGDNGKGDMRHQFGRRLGLDLAYRGSTNSAQTPSSSVRKVTLY